MVYILYYNFKSTDGNHAGMAYLAKCLSARDTNIKLIKHVSQDYKRGSYVGLIYSCFILLFLLSRLRKNDKVFFLEYLTRGIAYQHVIAMGLRMFKKKNKILGMVHLSGKHLMEYNKNIAYIEKKIAPLDKIIVLGSSLKDFFATTNYKGEIIRTFHYADTAYYKPMNLNIITNQINVIIFGSLKRNFEQLMDIITLSAKNIVFHLCAGRLKNSLNFNEYPNVHIYGYLDEGDLLMLLQKCQVNLSVLEDTVGSNTITCSMAAGLVQVASNVGSIKDYCNEKNSFVCNSTAEFVESINVLNNDRNLLNMMQLYALEFSKGLSIESFFNVFNTFFS